MNMELIKQVCSLELANRLKELGVKQESLYQWFQKGEYFFQETKIKAEEPFIEGHSSYCEFPYKCLGSAFTVAELISMLQNVAKEDIIVALDDKEVANTLAQLLCIKLQSSKENAGSGLMP